MVRIQGTARAMGWTPDDVQQFTFDRWYWISPADDNGVFPHWEGLRDALLDVCLDTRFLCVDVIDATLSVDGKEPTEILPDTEGVDDLFWVNI